MTTVMNYLSCHLLNLVALWLYSLLFVYTAVYVVKTVKQLWRAEGGERHKDCDIYSTHLSFHLMGGIWVLVASATYVWLEIDWILDSLCESLWRADSARSIQELFWALVMFYVVSHFWKEQNVSSIFYMMKHKQWKKDSPT